MAQIGRKIFYYLANGQVILDVPPYTVDYGDYTPLTTDQEFQTYTALQGIQQSAVSIIQMPYGQDEANFAKYPYHIDTTQNPAAIVWDVNNPLGQMTLDQLKAAKKAQLDDLCAQAIAGVFQSSALNSVHTYLSDADTMVKIQLVIKRLELNPDQTATFDYYTKDAGFLPHTLAQLHQVFCDGVDAGMVHEQHKADLYAKVDASTTADGVNSITW